MDEASAKEAEKMGDGPLIRGIPFLPPGGTRVLTWGQYAGLVKALGDGCVLVTANYKSQHFCLPWPIAHSTTCPLEIVSFEATDDSDKNYDRQIAKNVEKLTKAVQDAVKGITRKG
jgi:hypothetical protein